MNHTVRERPDKTKNGHLPTYVQDLHLQKHKGLPLGQLPPVTVIPLVGTLPAGTGPIVPLAGRLNGIGPTQSPLDRGTKVGALRVQTGDLLVDPLVTQLTP